MKVLKFCALLRKKLSPKYLHRYERRGTKNRRLRLIFEELKFKFYK